jgi:hypothetical protein
MEMFTESASRGLLAHTHHRTTKYIFLPLVSCGLASVWAHLGATGLAGEKTGLIDLSLLFLMNGTLSVERPVIGNACDRDPTGHYRMQDFTTLIKSSAIS